MVDLTTITLPACRRLRLAAAMSQALAWIAAACGSAPAADAPPPSTGRYADAHYAADEPPAARLGEPLLSYRRDDSEGPPAAIEPANPLRAAPEPAGDPGPAGPSSPSGGATAPESGLAAADIASAAVDAPAPAPLAQVETALDTTPTVATMAPAVEPQRSDAPLLEYDHHLLPAAAEVVAAPAAASTTPPAPTASVPSAASALPLPVDSENRRLAPRSAGALADAPHDPPKRGAAAWPIAFSKWQSLSTAGTGLVIVIGLFLICMVVLRRSGGKTAGMLPSEAFAVLGRAPLTSSSNAQLLRIGNKLVLVAMTPEGAQPLAEVTDPLEVDRIVALCASGKGHGPAAEFQQVLAQLAREPARGFLGGEASAGNRRRT
ncbi:MAG: flagellar biosynthetic protein FliO [Pirellulales bacterium]|nr:flagellar biosynthetic protein FliO [Pirellulales bacterium]